MWFQQLVDYPITYLYSTEIPVSKIFFTVWLIPQFAAKKFVIRDNLSTLDRATLFAAEFVATGILVFLGCMGCMNRIAPNGSIPHEQVSWTFGLAVMVAIQVSFNQKQTPLFCALFFIPLACIIISFYMLRYLLTVHLDQCFSTPGGSQLHYNLKKLLK